MGRAEKVMKRVLVLRCEVSGIAVKEVASGLLPSDCQLSLGGYCGSRLRS